MHTTPTPLARLENDEKIFLIVLFLFFRKNSSNLKFACKFLYHSNFQISLLQVFYPFKLNFLPNKVLEHARYSQLPRKQLVCFSLTFTIREMLVIAQLMNSTSISFELPVIVKKTITKRKPEKRQAPVPGKLIKLSPD